MLLQVSPFFKKPFVMDTKQTYTSKKDGHQFIVILFTISLSNPPSLSGEDGGERRGRQTETYLSHVFPGNLWSRRFQTLVPQPLGGSAGHLSPLQGQTLLPRPPARSQLLLPPRSDPGVYLLCLPRGARWASLPAGQRGQTDSEGGATTTEDEGAGEGIGGGETAPVDERGGRGCEDTGHHLSQDGGGFLCWSRGGSAATARPAVEGSSRTHQQSAFLHGHPDEVSLVNYWAFVDG